MIRAQTWYRVEPDDLAFDLDSGIAAQLADPLWLLGRQWQLGEHQGEDLASPVQVSFALRSLRVQGEAGLRGDPSRAPLAAVVQGEPDEWWTLGRRVRVGVAVEAVLPPRLRYDERLLLVDPPEPYEGCNGQIDGWRAWLQREEPWLAPHLAGDPFAEVPQPYSGGWNAQRLSYQATLSAGGTQLKVDQPRGLTAGDWYSVEAQRTPPVDSGDLAPHRTAALVRLRHPGAPLPRWWQLEDEQADAGGHAPDAAHFPTTLLISLLSRRSDDWYTFPVDIPVGHFTRLTDVRVRDTFGDTWEVKSPDDWSLHRVTGAPASAMLVFPANPSPLTGQEWERVELSLDEDSNVLWAVERRLTGRDVPTVPVPEPVAETLTYWPVSGVHERWHPYLRQGSTYVQGRLVESASAAHLLPEPEAMVLREEGGRPHVLEASAVPSTGVRLTQRYVLARATSGDPLLWLRTETAPLDAPAAAGTRFDALAHRGDDEPSAAVAAKET